MYFQHDTANARDVLYDKWNDGVEFNRRRGAQKWNHTTPRNLISYPDLYFLPLGQNVMKNINTSL